MSTIELQTVVSRSSELVHSEVDGEIAMMNVETGKYYGLTAVGADIWALLAEPIEARQICDELLGRYQVDRARCQEEVLRFLQRLAAEGVITALPGPTAH